MLTPNALFSFFLITLEPRVEWCKRLWALNTSSPRNRFTFLRSSSWEPRPSAPRREHVACNTSNQSASARLAPHHGVVCSVSNTTSLYLFYIYLFIYMYIYIYIYMYTDIYVYIYICKCICIKICTPRFFPLTSGVRTECRTILSRAISSVLTGGRGSAESHSSPTRCPHGFWSVLSYSTHVSLRRHLNHEPRRPRLTQWITTLSSQVNLPPHD